MELECLCLQVSKNIIGKNVASCLYSVNFLNAAEDVQKHKATRLCSYFSGFL